MHLTRLALTDFRSYAAADLSFEPGISTLLGANGQGKTNLVEAAAYVATLGSHRVANDAPLVRRGAERAILRAAITSAERDTLVEIEVNPGRANRARLNRAPVPRPRQVLGALRTVLFAPEDLALVKGDPEQRRRYLDELLVSQAPRYAGVRADYERVLRQRTALLKSARGRSGSRAFARARQPGGGEPRAGEPRGGEPRGGELDSGNGMGLAGALDVWDEHLASTGAELLAGRLELTAALRPLVARAYAEVSGSASEADAAGTADISYRQRELSPVRRPDEAFRDGGRRLPRRNGRPGLRCPRPGRAPGRTGPTARPWPDRCARRWPGPGRTSWSAGCAWSARTGTISSWASAPCPLVATRVTASRGRWPWRSGWPVTSCCARAGMTRYCCWTMCSPNWTPAAGTGWPGWWQAPSRCW